jgi:hypothetical protein
MDEKDVDIRTENFSFFRNEPLPSFCENRFFGVLFSSIRLRVLRVTH